MTMSTRANVDWDLCESYGVCVAAAPTIFDINDDDDLVVLKEHLDEAEIPQVQDAMMRCPKRAITLASP